MRARPGIAAALAAAILAATAGAAQAAPATVNVRIEGIATTIFEGTVTTDGMSAIQAPSDVAPRVCDGTNNGANPSPGPTPTTAALTALAAIGLPWDGVWYPGYDDYFVTQLGERQNEAANAYWGVLVNGAYTPVGGCQFRIHPGDDVLWVNNAFVGTAQKPLLALTGPAEAQPGQATTFSVMGNGAPFAGATVGGVAATGADGTIALVFDGPGWQSLKADAPSALRSARLRVCVRPADGASCDTVGDGPPPRLAVPAGGGGGAPVAPPAPAPVTPPPAVTPSPAAPAGRPAATLALARIARSRSVPVRWSVTDQGAGVRSWVLSGRERGQERFRVLERGTGGTRTRVRLAAGRVHELRLVVVDAAGTESAPSTAPVGVPLAARGGQVRVRGRATPAGRGVRVRRGARVTARLPMGTPTLLVRRARPGTRLVVRAQGRRAVVRVGRRTRQVAGPRMRRTGPVAVRVRRGAVVIDGIAPAP